MSVFTYEQLHNAVAVQAWEIWTNNGQGMDGAERARTIKAAVRAAHDTCDMDDRCHWLAGTLAHLTKKPPENYKVAYLPAGLGGWVWGAKTDISIGGSQDTEHEATCAAWLHYLTNRKRS